MIILQVYILKFASLFGEYVYNYCIKQDIRFSQLYEFVLCSSDWKTQALHYIPLRLYQLTRYVLSAHETNICVWNTGVL